MPILQKMSERQPCSDLVVDCEIRDPGYLPMSCNRHGRKRGRLFDRCIDSDKSLDTARQQHLGVGLQNPLVMAMDHGKKEIFRVPEILFDSANDPSSVGIA